VDDRITTFFAHLAAQGYEPLLHAVSATYRIEIEDKGIWGVIVKDGAMTVTRDLPQANCVIICDQALFDDILQGKQNPTTAFMQGRIHVIGSLSLAQMFQRLFRIRPETRLSEGEMYE